MTAAAQRILDEFEQLSASDRDQVARVILQQVAVADWSPLTDEELTHVAEQAFLEMDREEAGDDTA